MKPVDQTIFAPRQYDGKTFGNCVAACMASLMEVPIDSLPHCPHIPMLARSKELAAFGYGMLKIDNCDPRAAWQGFHIMCGLSPRTILGADGITEFPIHHAVVGFAGEMVHDPHPSRTGLQTTEEFWWLVALKPTALEWTLKNIVNESIKAAVDFQNSSAVTRDQMQKPFTV